MPVGNYGTFSNAKFDRKKWDELAVELAALPQDQTVKAASIKAIMLEMVRNADTDSLKALATETYNVEVQIAIVTNPACSDHIRHLLAQNKYTDFQVLKKIAETAESTLVLTVIRQTLSLKHDSGNEKQDVLHATNKRESFLQVPKIKRAIELTQHNPTFSFASTASINEKQFLSILESHANIAKNVLDMVEPISDIQQYPLLEQQTLFSQCLSNCINQLKWLSLDVIKIALLEKITSLTGSISHDRFQKGMEKCENLEQLIAYVEGKFSDPETKEIPLEIRLICKALGTLDTIKQDTSPSDAPSARKR